MSFDFISPVMGAHAGQAFHPGLGLTIDSAEKAMAARKRRRVVSRTHLDRPGTTEFRGHVALGEKPVLTTSRSALVLPSRRKPDKVRPSIVWRWQSVASYAAGDGTSINNRSLDLSIVGTVDNQTTPTGNTGFYLPMYAFDLTTQPGQGIAPSKSEHALQYLPMYRLQKRYALNAPLSLATANYNWSPVTGFQNGPSLEYASQSSPYYSPEIMDTGTQMFDMVKKEWNDIEILFQCSKKMECKIHTAVVKFDNFTGPRRQYTSSDLTARYNSTDAQPTLKTDDAYIRTEDQRGIDVFWESFWDKRISHPLAKYNQDNYSRRIKFIKHEVVDVHPDPDSAGTVFSHLKKIFVNGGDWVNCRCNSSADSTTAEILGTYQPGQMPPVIDTTTYAAGVGTELGFNRAYGFDVVKKQKIEHKLYDIYTRERENQNVWLLIWMDAPLPILKHSGFTASVGAGAYGDNVRFWPPTGDYTANNTDCCTMDIRVRSKYTYVEKHDISDNPVGMLYAYNNVD